MWKFVFIYVLFITNLTHCDLHRNIQERIHKATCKSKNINNRAKTKVVAVYQGAVAGIPCGLYVVPDEKETVVWMYAKSINQSLAPLKPRPNLVRKDANLTIYNMETKDAGVYSCHIDRRTRGMIFLEVTDEEYRLVKPKTSQGPYPEPPVHITNNLMLHSIWSPWSECNKCVAVGRRRRFGMCYVAVINEKLNTTLENKTNITKESADDLDLFKTFTTGIPCRSGLLPKSIGNLEAVKRRQNEIMLGLCRVPCKDITFEVRLISDRVLERDNNSDRSILQSIPPQPALPSSKLIFMERGKRLVLSCEGTTLRDIPYTWRIGTKLVVPKTSHEESGGRVHLNARDQLVFTRVEYADSNLYSCWQSEALCSTIKLKVECGVEQHWKRYGVAVTAIIVAAILLRIVIFLSD